MLFGAFVGGFLMMHCHKQAHLRLDAETAAVQTHNSLLRLSSSLSAEEVLVANAAIGQVSPDIEAMADADIHEGNFWTNLPRWGFWGVCGGAILVGGGAGYLSLWGAGWLGSLLTYWTIRGVYRVIRKTAPDCRAAQLKTVPAGASASFQREQNRLLPTLIKLVMLLLMALSVLAIVVWQLIGM
jgi:hypothetical protein